MTKEEYLLLCLAEECAEVSQRIFKALRFGLDEIQESNPEETKNNRQRISYEFNDLVTISELIEDLHEDYDFADQAQRERKLAKLDRYMKYSAKLGILTEPLKT
jgi:hypothetical protein